MADILEVYDIKNNTTENIGDKKSRANVAAAFNTSKTYEINDLTVYNGELYKFTAAHSAGAWDASHIAKTTIENEFVKKSGDTMTGSLLIKNTDFRIQNTSVHIANDTIASENQYSAFSVKDADNNVYGYTQAIANSDGTVSMQIVAINKATGASNTFNNNLTLQCKKDGTRVVSLFKQPWLTALGLGVESGNCTLNSTNCNSGVIAYRKFGPIINIFTSTPIKLKSSMSSSSISIGTVPDGFRPNYNNFFSIAGNSEKFGAVWINTSGTITFYKPVNVTPFPTDVNIYFSACYFNPS